MQLSGIYLSNLETVDHFKLVVATKVGLSTLCHTLFAGTRGELHDIRNCESNAAFWDQLSESP
jgi:hypothetical protein